MRRVYILFVLATVVFLSNSGLHPSGNTNAPGDSFCGNCHSGNGGSINGDVNISGLPSSIMPSTTYQLTVTVTNPAMNASKAGFQILALNQNNMNSGSFTNNSANSALRTQGSRIYLGHNPAPNFNGNASLTWTTDWTSPVGANGDVITIYGSSVIANGNGSNNGDRSVFTTTSGSISGGSAPLALTVTADAGTSCSDSNDGIATANPSGGQTPYMYSWDNGESSMQATGLSGGNHDVTVTDGSNNSIVGSVFINSPSVVTITNSGKEDVSCYQGQDGVAQFTASGGTSGYTYSWSDGGSGSNRSNLFAGFYQVTATDNNGCTATSSVTINEPNEIIAAEVVSNISCSGQSDGSILINANGGTGQLIYNWSNGSSMQNQFDLPAGPYGVTITDDNNCTAFYNYLITQPSPINITVDNTTDVSCQNTTDGTASLSGNGGTGTYSYTWSDGGSGANRSDLAAGVIAVTISDANGCEANTTLSIGTPPLILIDSVGATPASCLGAMNGSLEVTSSGGSGDKTYLWSNGSMDSLISDISAGSYTVTVTDAQGCNEQKTLTLGAQNTASLSITNTTNVSCSGGNNGSATLNLTNGTGYEINWSTGQTGESITNLPVGTYTALAADTAGCQSNPITVEITEPSPISNDSLSIVQPLCFGNMNGSLYTNYMGGTGALNYQWSNGQSSSSLQNINAGQYTVTITDQNQCKQLDTFIVLQPPAITVDSTIELDLLCFNDSSGLIEVFASGGTGTLGYQWTTGQSSNTISNLPAGNYALSIEDSNMCLITRQFGITEPLAIAINQTIVNESTQGAEDGSIKLNVTGGTPSYIYLWSNGDTTDSIGGLTPGQYIVTVTDNNGCTQEEAYTISRGDCILSATAATTDVSCSGGMDGSIIIDVSDNLGDVTITVSGGFTDLSSLPAGAYDLTVMDTAGCSFTISDITITEPSALFVNVVDVKASGGTNGAIDITPAGGIMPYTYSWVNDEGIEVSTSQDLENLPPGNYTLTLTDSNACTFTLGPIEIIFDMVAVNDAEDFYLEIYPSPASELLTISADQTISKVELYTSEGRLAVQKHPITKAFNLDISDQTNGFYILKVYNENKAYSKKIFIE